MRPFEKENCKVMYLIYIPRPFINGHKKYQFKYQYKLRWQLSSITPQTYIHGKSVPWNRGNSSRVARRLNFFFTQWRRRTVYFLCRSTLYSGSARISATTVMTLYIKKVCLNKKGPVNVYVVRTIRICSWEEIASIDCTLGSALSHRCR